MLIGGIACILYGSPRLTKDIDILLEPTLVNATRLLRALREINFGTAELTTPEKIIENEANIFNDYIRLDVLTKIKGISFEKAWKNRKIRKIKGIKLPLLTLDDLIISKQASGRDIDLQDMQILKKIKRLKSGKLIR